jgi:hypothetical protein
MKGAFFNRSLEWSIETQSESWQQGGSISGILKVKNHGPESAPLHQAGAGLAYADLKKVFAKSEGILKPTVSQFLERDAVGAGEALEMAFTLTLPENCQVTDKKASYFLTYGQGTTESHLQLIIVPRALFAKIIGLLDTFHRFKLKDVKASKAGVEYKLLPPTARDMANIDHVLVTFSMKGSTLGMAFDFQVKKLDTSSITTKINKESLTVQRDLSPKDYSFGGDLINQDQLLKVLGEIIGEAKMKAVF